MFSTAPAQPRVLVIDDDPTVLQLLTVLLEAEDYAVITAGSRQAALALVRSGTLLAQPSVVLCDLQMPGADLPAFVSQLRSACSGGAAILAISATDPRNGEAAAFDGFLRKPFTAGDLTAVLQHHPPAPAPAAPANGHGGPPMLDENTFATLSRTMRQSQLREIYSLCLADALARIGRMESAAQAGDAQSFVREAHAIKGSCGMLGASEMQSLAAAMETGALACTSLLNDFRVAADRLQRMLDARN